jgi:predicted RNase H-like HicB family nuclease
MQNYIVVIEKTGTNYSAFSPDLPGCITTGFTVDDTLKNMKEAMELYLEEADVFPESKGVDFYLKNGLLNSSNISAEYLISNVQIPTSDFA